MRILLIGGTRFIGPYVIERLISEGHTISLFHRGETESSFSAGVQHIHGERADLPSFRVQFEQFAPQVVLDMIAMKGQDALILQECFRHLAERVVVVSSSDVYRGYDILKRLQPGPPDRAPLTEDSPLREILYPYRATASGPDDSKYDYDKIPIEQALMNDAELPGTILRLPAVYGPGDRQHRLFGYLKRMDDRRPAILIDEGQAGWRWTRGYVENVASAIALAATDERAARRIYNVGEPDALTEADWVRAIGRAAGWDGQIVAVPGDLLPPHMVFDLDWQQDLSTDTTRLREELGYREEVSREEALRRTVAWEREHPPEKIEPKDFDYAAEDAVLEKLRGKGDK